MSLLGPRHNNPIGVTLSIDMCPRCTYPLTGLPQRTACPECGLRRDEASRMCYLPQVETKVQGMLMLPILIISGCNLLTPNLSTTMRILAVGILLFVAVGVLVTVVRPTCHAHRFGEIVAATPDGLLHSKNNSIHQMPTAWASIRQLDFGIADTGTTVHLHSGTTFELPACFKTRGSYDEFVVACRHYGQQDGGGVRASGHRLKSCLDSERCDTLRTPISRRTYARAVSIR